MKRPIIAALLAASTVVSLPMFDAIAGRDASVELAQATPMAEGEVRRIDTEQGKVTLRRGPIASLEMGAMSMVFRVKDPAMFDRMTDGQLTVMRFEPVQ